MTEKTVLSANQRTNSIQNCSRTNYDHRIALNELFRVLGGIYCTLIRPTSQRPEGGTRVGGQLGVRPLQHCSTLRLRPSPVSIADHAWNVARSFFETWLLSGKSAPTSDDIVNTTERVKPSLATVTTI